MSPVNLSAKWTVRTSPSPLADAVGSSLLVGTGASRLLWAIVRGLHQTLLLIIKWHTDKRLSSNPSCGTESMRRLSGRINQTTSLYLQSFMALRCLCSGGGRKGERAPRVAPEKHASLNQHLSLPISRNYITSVLCQVTKHNQWILHLKKSVVYVCFLVAVLTSDWCRRLQSVAVGTAGARLHSCDADPLK